MSKLKTLWSLYTASLLIPFGIIATPTTSTIHPTIETKKIPQSSQESVQNTKSTSFKPFTGKVIGNKVRMRLQPDVDSYIVKELDKEELVLILNEKNGFYAIQPSSDIQAYIFRSFVLEDTVEGNRVNVRLAPHREAPIIGHLNTGTKVGGKISEENGKWLQITPPENTVFYVAKEFIEYAGSHELKEMHENRRMNAKKLLESNALMSQAELHKIYEKIDFQKIEDGYTTLITNYADFPDEVRAAQRALALCQEKYLQKKISFLEKKATQISKKNHLDSNVEKEDLAFSEKMKAWEPFEEALYLSWSSMHYAKTMNDFYTDERLKAITISGVLESYSEAVKNKPGDFILMQNDIPIAYLYSTQVNLQEYIGKKITLSVSNRPNNNFAFQAYYVHEIED